MNILMFDAMHGPGVLLLFLPYLLLPVLLVGIISLAVYAGKANKKRRETPPPDANDRELEQILRVIGDDGSTKKEDTNDRSV